MYGATVDLVLTFLRPPGTTLYSLKRLRRCCFSEREAMALCVKFSSTLSGIKQPRKRFSRYWVVLQAGSPGSRSVLQPDVSPPPCHLVNAFHETSAVIIIENVIVDVMLKMPLSRNLIANVWM